MSLIKIPLIMLTAFGFHLCMTPPNRAPPKKEQYFPKSGPARAFEIATRLVLSVGDILNLLQWGIAIVECMAVYNSRHPNNTLSYYINNCIATNISTPTPFFLASCLVTYVGYALRVLAFHTLGKMFTFELTTQKEHRLVTSGPYTIVRHPSYTGGIIGFFGHAGVVFGAHSWMRESGVLTTPAGIPVLVWLGGMLTLLVLLTIRVRGEDEMMHKTFGPTWEEWARRVRYRLIPGIY